MNPSTISQSTIIRDLIVNPVGINEDLLCLICQKLVVNPRECSQCQSLFCLNCITSRLQNNNVCPYLKCNQEIQLKNPHKLVQKQISQIQVKCVNKGCDQQIQIQNLDSHLLQCEYVQTKCPIPECDFKDNLKQIKIHQLNCAHRSKICLQCETTYKINEEHNCLINLLKKIKIQEENLLAYQQKTDQTIMDLVGRLNQQENQQGNYQKNQQGNQQGNYEKNQQVNQQGNQQGNQLENQQGKQQKGHSKHKCEQGHELTWIAPKKGIQCEVCKQTVYNVRYVCEPCKKGYCQKCKTPQLNGQFCQDNHTLEFFVKPKSGLICDFCRQLISSEGESVYSDRICDLDVCGTCFQEQIK